MCWQAMVHQSVVMLEEGFDRMTRDRPTKDDPWQMVGKRWFIEALKGVTPKNTMQEER